MRPPLVCFNLQRGSAAAAAVCAGTPTAATGSPTAAAGSPIAPGVPELRPELRPGLRPELSLRSEAELLRVHFCSGNNVQAARHFAAQSGLGLSSGTGAGVSAGLSGASTAEGLATLSWHAVTGGGRTWQALAGCTSSLLCSRHAVHPCGDHIVVLAEVLAVYAPPGGDEDDALGGGGGGGGAAAQLMYANRAYFAPSVPLGGLLRVRASRRHFRRGLA